MTMAPMLAIQLLQYAAPVGIAALGEAVGQKSGVMNIGLEGTMLASAFAATVVSLATKNPVLGLLAGMAVGLCVTMLSGFFAITLRSDQVVVGTAINLLSLGVTGTLFRAQFGQSGQLISLPPLARWNGFDIVTVLMVLLGPALWFALNRSAWGLAVRSAGEYPKATEAAGFSVSGLRYSAVTVAGVLAGLAGAYLAIGVAGSFAEGMTVGRGFVAIAMVTFGRWRPLPVLASAMAIGFLELLQFKFQAMGLNLPFQLFLALPYVVALMVLVFIGKGSISPQALGQPYRREK